MYQGKWKCAECRMPILICLHCQGPLSPIRPGEVDWCSHLVACNRTLSSWFRSNTSRKAIQGCDEFVHAVNWHRGFGLFMRANAGLAVL